MDWTYSLGQLQGWRRPPRDGAGVAAAGRLGGPGPHKKIYTDDFHLISASFQSNPVRFHPIPSPIPSAASNFGHFFSLFSFSDHFPATWPRFDRHLAAIWPPFGRHFPFHLITILKSDGLICHPLAAPSEPPIGNWRWEFCLVRDPPDGAAFHPSDKFNLIATFPSVFRDNILNDEPSRDCCDCCDCCDYPLGCVSETTCRL